MLSQSDKQGSESDRTKTEALIGRCTDCGKEYNQNKHFLCPCVKTDARFVRVPESAPGNGERLYCQTHQRMEPITDGIFADLQGEAFKAYTCTPPQENQALQRAIDYLGAVEVTPGRVAVKDGARYLVIDTDDAPGLAFEFETGEPDPDACAQVTEMPAWWSPDRQTAWRHPEWKNIVLSPPHSGYEKVTCDLTTGEEIPC